MQPPEATWKRIGVCAVIGLMVPVYAQHPPAIESISVCSPTGAGGQGSCPTGSSDTHQIVLGGAVQGGKIYGQNHNVTSVPAGSPVYMQLDSTAGAVPRIGLPPSPYSGTTRIANQLNNSLQRGELLTGGGFLSIKEHGCVVRRTKGKISVMGERRK